VKFLIDMPVSPGVAGWLAEKNHDAVHASRIGLHKAADKDILEEARKQERIRHHGGPRLRQLLAMSKAKDPGIILFRGGNYGEKEMLALLARVLANVPEDKIRSSVTVVDRARIRCTSLPIE
jgi:predicted nuclease of predicted toxin-antitoxin system